MNPQNELVLRITPEKQRIQVESSDNGVITCKEITPDTLFECIKGSMPKRTVASGFLPSGCFHMCTHEDGSRDYCLWHSTVTADISYYTTQYHNFPLPRLVFGFRVSTEGKVYRCRLGVTEDKTPTADTKMFHYPFSNVGGFNLCIGNNPLPVYKKPHTLATLPTLLLSLPNNDDTYNSRNNKLNLPYRELLNHLKDKNTAYYYSDILIPNGKTLNDFIGG